MITVLEAEDFSEDLPKWLRMEMARTRMTCAEVGAALRVSPKTVSLWRCGRHSMGADMFARLAKLFGYRTELRRIYEVVR